MPKRHPDGNQPHLLIIEFPSKDDADAAHQLIAAMEFGPTIVRAKNDRFRPNAFHQPKMTAMRKALASHRSFDFPMVAAAHADCGYAPTETAVREWMRLAQEVGVLRSIERGTWEFLPLPAKHDSLAANILAGAPDINCFHCQPSELSL